jgi:hypothetical protein
MAGGMYGPRTTPESAAYYESELAAGRLPRPRNYEEYRMWVDDTPFETFAPDKTNWRVDRGIDNLSRVVMFPGALIVDNLLVPITKGTPLCNEGLAMLAGAGISVAFWLWALSTAKKVLA